MTWEYAMAHARRRAQETGRRYYVRGFQRTISHVGEWAYGAYDTPTPDIRRSWPRRCTCDRRLS